MAKSMDSGARLPELRSRLCYLLVMQLWTSYLTTLWFKLNTHKMGIKIVPFSLGYYRIKWTKICKLLSTVPDNRVSAMLVLTTAIITRVYIMCMPHIKCLNSFIETV